jgi:hypothetical protein
MSLERWLIEAKPPVWAWLETVILTLLAAGLAHLAEPSNPFFVGASFPWIIFAPMLLALRYGVLSGVASCALLTALWFLARKAGLVAGEPPALYLLGALILTMVCGEFADIWKGRLRRLEITNRYLDQRLELITKQHYLLMLSHDRLEHDQLAKPFTLRAALVRVRELAERRNETGVVRFAGMRELMQLLGQFCQLEVAGVHVCIDGVPQNAIHTALGPAEPLIVDDPLVQYCLGKRELSHVQMSAMQAAPESQYVIVAPLQSNDGELIALLAVRQMPFLALHEETLSTLAVLLGYYADALKVSGEARSMQRELPGCPPDFAEEINRSHRMWREADIVSSLLLLKFGARSETAANTPAFVAHVKRQMRTLDMAWEIGSGKNIFVLLLLPLTGPAGVEGCIARLDVGLQQRHLAGFEAAGITHYREQLKDQDPGVTLKLMFGRCDVHL